MKPLLGTHPRQVADDQRRPWRLRVAPIVALELDSEARDVDAGEGKLEQLGHRRRVVVVRRHQHVHLAHPLPHLLYHQGLVGFVQVFEEDVLALKAADDQRLRERLADPVGHPHQHRVRQVNDVRPELAGEPPREALELGQLTALLAPHHGQREFPEFPRVGRRRRTRHPGQQPGVVEQAANRRRRATPDRQLLLQVDVHCAVEDPAVAHVLLVGPKRRVDRQQQRVVPPVLEFADQGVVVNAAPADHPAGAGRQIGDPQRLARIAHEVNLPITG